MFEQTSALEAAAKGEAGRGARRGDGFPKQVRGAQALKPQGGKRARLSAALRRGIAFRAMTSRVPPPKTCPFCNLLAERIIDRTGLAVVIRDAFPVSPGHTLVLPVRHVGSLFDTTDAERGDLLALLDRAKCGLDEASRPDGYNVGVNDGVAAGQTVPHLHIHLIPRYRGDQPDARGGIRWIFPERARYWGTGGEGA
jgi:diadenosine tetraphosphate (Ap4A) HIT family hydrolase